MKLHELNDHMMDPKERVYHIISGEYDLVVSGYMRLYSVHINRWGNVQARGEIINYEHYSPTIFNFSLENDNHIEYLGEL